MAGFDIDTLLSEISPDSPCGRDITYDNMFLELEQFARGTSDTQVGSHIQEGEDPDWEKVRRLSLDLFEHSHDLRLTLYLTLAALCQDGIAGLCDGLTLLRGLIERHWDQVFPQLDPDDDNDPTERINIIGALSPPNTVMSDQDPMKFRTRLMDVPLCTPDDSRLPHATLRQILMASGELPLPEEGLDNLPTIQLIDAAFEQTPVEALQGTERKVRECLEHLNAMDTFLIDHVGAGSAPDFSRLERLLNQIKSKVGDYLERRGYGTDVSLIKHIKTKMGSYLDRKHPNSSPSDSNLSESEGDEGNDSRGGGPLQTLSGQITSKQEVLKALDLIVNYYEQNEPSSPVPLLIKRAKRLVGKSFVDIIRDLSPDAISQVRMVSGEQDEPEAE